MRYKFKLNNLKSINDCKELADKIEKLKIDAILTNSEGYCVSAKSLLGIILAAFEWDAIYLESDSSEIFDFMTPFA